MNTKAQQDHDYEAWLAKCEAEAERIRIEKERAMINDWFGGFDNWILGYYVPN